MSQPFAPQIIKNAKPLLQLEEPRQHMKTLNILTCCDWLL
jgi:hypothetical protein